MGLLLAFPFSTMNPMPVKKYKDTKFNRPSAPSSRPKSPEFCALQKEWYARLRATGFKELEFFHTDGTSTNALLRDSITRMQQRYSAETTYYFTKARWYLQHAGLEPLDREIWAMHTDGRTSKDIATILGKSRYIVLKHVKRLKTAMLADKRYEAIEASDIAAMAERLMMKVTK